jgi:ATP adenylyltransferase
MRYVRRAGEPAGCLFCRVARARGGDRERLVVWRGPRALIMLNRYPYNPGHLMVVAVRHVAGFAALTEEERVVLLGAVALAERALGAEYRPQAMNLGANLGRAAGAGFPGHLHFHLVPRWSGDTNFMPILGGVKVLPETLGQSWSRLRRAIRKLEAAPPRARGRGARAGRAPRRSRGRRG